MSNKIFEFETDDFTYSFRDYEGSATVHFIANEILYGDVYKLNKISLRPDQEIIDVGSNIGIFTCVAARKTGCKVIAFEPVFESWEHGLINQALNGIDPGQVHSYNRGVGCKGTSQVHYEAHRSGNACCQGPGEIRKFECISVLPHITEKTGYIKIDCEGCEYDLLPEILPKIKHVPYLAVEVHAGYGKISHTELHQLVKSEYPGELIWLTA